MKVQSSAVALSGAWVASSTAVRCRAWRSTLLEACLPLTMRYSKDGQALKARYKGLCT